MFDTMTMTKAVGAVCGALLVFLLGNWAASAIFNTTVAGHGDEPAPQAYVVAAGADTETAAADDAAAPAGGDFAALYASADAAAGEKVYAKCKACHKLDGKDGTGPHLNGVVDRPIASSAGFSYSSSMAEHNGATWAPETLDTFLTAPKKFASNTKMAFAGLPKAEDRANLIAFLATQQ